MQNDFVPVVTAGRNVTVERTERGYRVSSSASPATVTLYTGYLAVRAESPTGDGKSAAVRVVDGSLPAEQQLNYLAGMVEVDHIFHPEASDSGTAVQPELRRYRVEINPRARLHLDEGESYSVNTRSFDKEPNAIDNPAPPWNDGYCFVKLGLRDIVLA